ncbi:hypothetical protein DXG01_001718 [Tephrocybe rancida]|nr:hypothetical protein DXG01_001718 [Tephrocybe rancida]
MQKSEPWINTFMAALSYLFRCNTDVTSLRSGTAIKSVLLYVTKYVTKPALKTCTAFGTVKSIFSKHSDIIDGPLPRTEKARSLMTKMANVLSAKSEMGSPMICMYLLGNPDHYTGHTFETVHWPSYVKEAQHVWTTDNDPNQPLESEKLPIIKKHGRVVGLAQVYDYIYRSSELANMSLYKWVSRSKRVKMSEAKTAKKTSPNSAVTVAFLPNHPLADTHRTLIHPPHSNRIPNLIGGTLPRSDQGDRQQYCLTMLTLFKPWRNGCDLKMSSQDWNESFTAHKFSERHLELMKNMNIRYECMDARDDFYAQLKSGAITFSGPAIESSDIDEMQQRDIFDDEDSCKVIDFGIHDLETLPGKKELRRRADLTKMTAEMAQLGWDKPLPGQVLPGFMNHAVAIPQLLGHHWKTLLNDQKNAVIKTCQQNIHPLSSNTTWGPVTAEPGKVDIVTRSFLEAKYKSDEWEPIIESISTDFSLNEEQLRAFRIVANHAASNTPEQLKMYMGGMGGTGKTQVLRALVKYFEARGEAHRLVVVAPTGTAASLLGGSTYHSMFGINDMGSVSKNQMAQIKSRLLGVEYVLRSFNAVL